MKYVLRLGNAPLPQPNYINAPLESRYPELPFDSPSPSEFHVTGKNFCVSGEFPSGRKRVIEAIEERGGNVQDGVNFFTHVVIVGEQPSKGWKYGNYGNKINKAIEFRQRNGKPLIIREALWLTLSATSLNVEQHLDELPKLRERSTWLLHQFESGYSDGWACCLPDAFRRALDIQQTVRVELGRERLIWTQGANFDFSPGDRFYDSRDVYHLPWNEALRRMGCSIQVTARTGEILHFEVWVPNNERTTLVLRECLRATLHEFVRLLITGICRPSP